MIDVSEGLTAHVAAMVLFYWLWGLLGGGLLLCSAHDTAPHGCGGCGQDACHRSDIGRVSIVLTGDSGYKWHHGGRHLNLLRPGNHFDARVAGLVPPQVVAVSKSFTTVTTDEGRL